MSLYDQSRVSLLLILQSDISPDLLWTSRTVKAPSVTLWPESSFPLTNTTIWYIPWLTVNIKDSQSSQCDSMTRVQFPSSNTTIWYIPWLTVNIKDSQSSQCHSLTRVQFPSYIYYNLIYPLTYHEHQGQSKLPVSLYDQSRVSFLLILQSDISPDLPWTSRTVKGPSVTLWPESSFPLTNTTIWYIHWLTMNIKDSQRSQCHSMTRVQFPSY